MKKIIILLFAMALVVSLNAQKSNFFKPLKKPTPQMMARLGAAGAITQNVIRPIANIASYAVPDNLGLSGVGISWQHQDFNVPDDRWKVVYSINALTWYSTQQTVLYGIAIGALNNIVMVGVATDSHKIYGTVGIGININ